MTTYGITGATGFLGGQVIDDLLEFGVAPEDIIGIYRNEEKTLSLKEKGIQLRFGDYRAKDFSKEVFEGIDRLLFVSSSEEDDLIRLQEHLTVVTAAKVAEVGYIVYTGIAFPDKTIFPMENVHVATEFFIKASQIPYTFLRNSFYLDVLLNKEELNKQLSVGKLFSGTTSALNFVPRKDYALATATVLTEMQPHIGKTYNLTSNQTFTMVDLVKTISKISQQEITLVEGTDAELTEEVSNLGLNDALFLYHLHYGYTPGWADKVSQDLVNLIGESKMTKLADYVQELLEK
ncbi:NmrA family NAD(P)-binding protein [Enterococcus sp. HY326]|uniref:NmrA family NAD(P)-binding protein n=1 Tax=Enterococcus sp. HY326 TaxID=2971265 RepID=UPI00223FACCB|nr:NmrA family NAD(P)-binding protein [Enterococcus sp. HY326]